MILIYLKNLLYTFVSKINQSCVTFKIINRTYFNFVLYEILHAINYYSNNNFHTFTMQVT